MPTICMQGFAAVYGMLSEESSVFKGGGGVEHDPLEHGVFQERWKLGKKEQRKKKNLI